MGDSKPEKVVATAKDVVTAAAVVVDVGATGGVLTGAKVGIQAMAAGWRRVRERRVEEAIDLVAAALDDESAARIGAELRAGDAAAWAAFEMGFRDLQAAIHEDAKRCIAVVVADYLMRGALPDREYQLAAGLLVQCDRELLEGLVVLTFGYLDAARHTKQALLGVRQANPRQRIDGACWWVAPDETDSRDSSKALAMPRQLAALVQLLVRQEFVVDGATTEERATVPPPHGDRGARGQRLAWTALPEHHQRWERLRLYLAPITQGG